MLGGICMKEQNVVVNKIAYTVNNRNILLSKDIVDKYSDIVCPISERLLSSLIAVLGKNCNDKILSAKIESDMEDEIGEYGN